jgi:hypothetical protein
MTKVSIHKMLLDFSKAEYENIEAVALAYIYAVILVVFLFKSHDLATIDEIEQTSHVHNQGDRDGVQFLFKESIKTKSRVFFLRKIIIIIMHNSK